MSHCIVLAHSLDECSDVTWVWVCEFMCVYYSPCHFAIMTVCFVLLACFGVVWRVGQIEVGGGLGAEIVRQRRAREEARRRAGEERRRQEQVCWCR
jgi:hypothetical protein